MSPTGITEISFGIGFSLSDPVADAAGGFDIFDENGLFLDGDLLAVGFLEDAVELQFGNLGGAAAGLFGSSVLALISFDNPLGADPFAAFVDGDAYFSEITISNVTNAPPIPLPAGFPLFLSGMLALGFVARQKQKSGRK